VKRLEYEISQNLPPSSGHWGHAWLVGKSGLGRIWTCDLRRIRTFASYGRRTGDVNFCHNRTYVAP